MEPKKLEKFKELLETIKEATKALELEWIGIAGYAKISVAVLLKIQVSPMLDAVKVSSINHRTGLIDSCHLLFDLYAKQGEKDDPPELDTEAVVKAIEKYIKLFE